MTSYEILSLIIAAIAFLFSIYNFARNLYLTRQYNMMIQGQTEMQIREMISNAKREVHKRAIELDKDISNTTLQKAFNAADEDLKNAYEEACSKYLDNKTDRERFKKMYSVEIRQLVENPNQKEFFNSISSNYKCIVKVYREWNDLEK